MISKRARALRYVARCKKPGTPLKAFMTEAGGVNACNTRYAKFKRSPHKRPPASWRWWRWRAWWPRWWRFRLRFWGLGELYS